MLHIATRLAVLTLAACGMLREQPGDAEQAGIEVPVTGATVIGFFPPISADPIEASPAVREGLAHLAFALSDVARCMEPRTVSVRIERARVLVLRTGEQRTRIALPLDGEHAVGAYLVEPGREPEAVYAPAGAGALQILLANAAADYFDAPNCRRAL